MKKDNYIIDSYCTQKLLTYCSLGFDRWLRSIRWRISGKLPAWVEIIDYKYFGKRSISR